MHFEHHVAVGAKRGDPIAFLCTCFSQQSCEAVRPIAEFAISETSVAVHDGRALRKYFRGAIQKIRRVQRSSRTERHFPLRLQCALN
jgi:hypothetical protein